MSVSWVHHIKPLQPQGETTAVLLFGQGLAERFAAESSCAGAITLILYYSQSWRIVPHWTAEPSSAALFQLRPAANPPCTKYVWRLQPETKHRQRLFFFFNHLACQTWGYIIRRSILSPAKNNTSNAKGVSDVTHKKNWNNGDILHILWFKNIFVRSHIRKKKVRNSFNDK